MIKFETTKIFYYMALHLLLTGRLSLRIYEQKWNRNKGSSFFSLLQSALLRYQHIDFMI
jgi:hypothetical protein